MPQPSEYVFLNETGRNIALSGTRSDIRTSVVRGIVVIFMVRIDSVAVEGRLLTYSSAASRDLRAKTGRWM